MNAPAPKPISSAVKPIAVAMPDSMHPGLPLLLKRAQERRRRRFFSDVSDVKVVCFLLAFGLLMFWFTR